MYKDLKRTCTAIFLRNKPFVLWLSRCCLRRGLSLGNVRKPRQQRRRERRQTKGLLSRKMAVARAL